MEDLNCHYDLSVRDSTGGVVQFKYGDDGLDPAMIEGDQQPVEFVRNLRHVIATVPYANETALTKADIDRILAKELKKPAFQKCSNEYLKCLKNFVENEIEWRLKSSKRLLIRTSKFNHSNPIPEIFTDLQSEVFESHD